MARALADQPDAVRVTEREHRGTTLVELYVAPGDLGRVIGRQGRTAAALRTLAATAGETDGKTRRRSKIRDRPAEAADAMTEWDDDGARRAHRAGARQPRAGDRESGDRLSRGAVSARAPMLLVSARRRHASALTVDDGRGFTRAGRSSGSTGIETMNDAEALAGVELRVPRRRAACRCRRARSTATIWSAARCETRERRARSGA